MRLDPSLPPVTRLAKYFWFHHAEMWRHIARRWYAYLAAVLLWLVAAHYLGFNLTDSMPERVLWLERGVVPARGDLVVFSFEGRGAAARFNGLRWFKRVIGVPGDRIAVNDREVVVNGVAAGRAAALTPRGLPLAAIEPGVIPPGSYYLGGVSQDSLDSRYSIVGLVRAERILARAHAIF